MSEITPADEILENLRGDDDPIDLERPPLDEEIQRDTYVPSRDEIVAQAVEFLAMQNAAISGENGHDHTYVIIAQLRDIGLSRPEAHDLVMGSEWNARCEPPWNDDEIREFVNSIYDYGANLQPEEDLSDGLIVNHDFTEVLDEVGDLSAGERTELIKEFEAGRDHQQSLGEKLAAALDEPPEFKAPSDWPSDVDAGPEGGWQDDRAGFIKPGLDYPHLKIPHEDVRCNKLRPDFEGANPAINTTNPKDILGVKKVDMSLVPASSKIAQALAMADGAAKYGPYNWRDKKVKARIYVAAAQRHLDCWLDGEEDADDSGMPHLGHVLACIGIIVDAQATGNLVDDRPLPGAAADMFERYRKD